MKRLLPLVLLLVLVAFALPAPSAHADAPAITAIDLDAPDTITVGDRIRYVITMEATAGTAIALAPDALPPYLSLARTPQLTGRDIGDGRAELVFVIEVAPFAPGQLDVPPLKLRYREANGAEGEIVTVGLPQLPVTSVLDPSAEVVPLDLKPQADLGNVSSPILWRGLAAAAVVFVLLVALIVWRVRASRKVVFVPEPVAAELGPEDRARLILDKAGLDFSSEGDFQTYYATLAVTVRTYLTERFGFPAFALTTRELQNAMVRSGVDRWQARIASGLLEQCDAVVYAHYRPASERADADLTAAYEIVEMGPT